MIAASKKGKLSIKTGISKRMSKNQKQCRKQNVEKLIAQPLVYTSKGIPSL